MIINLFGNSLKFTKKGSRHVTVAAAPEDARPGSLRFGVSNTDIGIPQDKLAAVFESSTQADSWTTRRLVELMGGRIWVESTVGVESTFFFNAMFTVQEDQTEPWPETVAALPTNADLSISGMRILMADDSDDNRFRVHGTADEAGPKGSSPGGAEQTRCAALAEFQASRHPSTRSGGGGDDVVPGYPRKRRAEIPVYQDALTNGNFETIRMMARKTKGTGAGYGFPVLTELAAVIEKAAERRDGEQVRVTIFQHRVEV